MKRLVGVLAIAFAAVPLFGAIEYDFVQKLTRNDGVTPSSDLTGRATIDGARSRVDFLAGNLYPPGTYVVSTDASRRLFFVDPVNKWFTEVSTTGVASALAATQVKITNQKSESAVHPDKTKIAGIETTHYHLSLSFDISVTKGGVVQKQRAQIEIDSWTTPQFSNAHQSLVADSMRTGVADIDRVLAEEASKIQGFPLRRVVTVRMTSDMPKRSKLEIPSERTTTRETLITSIRETAPEASIFVVPATYRRAEAAEAPRSTSQVLTFEPVKK